MSWINNFQKPLLIQAPMDGVSDYVFRKFISKVSPPDVLFTEFTSLKNIISHSEESVKRLSFAPTNSAKIAQVWSSEPSDYKDGVKILSSMDFDGVDINMGCPSSKLIKKKACSYFISDLEKAKEVILSAKSSLGNDMTLSVKTRLGYSVYSKEWFELLLSLPIDMLTIHARTVLQLSNGRPDFYKVKEVCELRDKMGVDVRIIANGDISSIDEAKFLCDKYLCDGVMIGRALVKNPKLLENKDFYALDKNEIISLLVEYLDEFDAFYKGRRDFNSLKKMFKYLTKNFARSEVLLILESKSLIDMKNNLISLYEKK